MLSSLMLFDPTSNLNFFVSPCLFFKKFENSIMSERKTSEAKKEEEGGMITFFETYKIKYICGETVFFFWR
jgi:hypothetical protein